MVVWCVINATTIYFIYRMFRLAKTSSQDRPLGTKNGHQPISKNLWGFCPYFRRGLFKRDMTLLSLAPQECRLFSVVGGARPLASGAAAGGPSLMAAARQKDELSPTLSAHRSKQAAADSRPGRVRGAPSNSTADPPGLCSGGGSADGALSTACWVTTHRGTSAAGNGIPGRIQPALKRLAWW